ncbi:hypothetical protein SAMN04487848_2354 [Microbacterium sp. ru370.1]|uniref:hypothetical protein n=1 Tax=unclassified Microbacterium TaxID=2609290 RepID=UPI000880EBE8|nr:MULTISPECIES: hypothetical protein [unclassified Microbacterium]SDO83383.1 hypothetical protein SAMN04487848_2354 [Microbacterium sp. ru370.1]SIT90169.1 hypothetical protein SAMN05880579_2349 [Microbacterium sp. RU1D]
MQILLGLLIGAVIGLIAHVALPGRHLRGAALAPLTGAASAGIVWTALTWMGLGDSPLPWVLAVVASAATTLSLVSLTTRSRSARDAADRARLPV